MSKIIIVTTNYRSLLELLPSYHHLWWWHRCLRVKFKMNSPSSTDQSGSVNRIAFRKRLLKINTRVFSLLKKKMWLRWKTTRSKGRLRRLYQPYPKPASMLTLATVKTFTKYPTYSQRIYCQSSSPLMVGSSIFNQPTIFMIWTINIGI